MSSNLNTEMRTSSGIKINTTIIIFLAFVFRLLFMNGCLASPLKSTQANKFASSHFSKGIEKRRQNIDPVVASSPEEYTSVDVYEENANDKEDLIKANSPVILSIFYSFLHRIVFIPKSTPSFDLIKCDIYPKKYLALSILRI
ncbi:MAG: hypothetical protein V4506_00675 [Bacteroidota bacterium]